MDKTKINYLVDVIMALSFFAVAFTGLVLLFYLPGGMQGGGYREFLGITKHTWSSIHNISGVIMILLAMAHLVLHRKWMVSMTKNVFRKK